MFKEAKEEGIKSKNILQMKFEMKNSVVFNFLIKRNILNIKENLKHTEKEKMRET